MRCAGRLASGILPRVCGAVYNKTRHGVTEHTSQDSQYNADRIQGY